MRRSLNSSTYAATGLDVEIIVYPGLRHSMSHWTRFMDGGFPRGYLETIGAFAVEHSER